MYASLILYVTSDLITILNSSNIFLSYFSLQFKECSQICDCPSYVESYSNSTQANVRKRRSAFVRVLSEQEKSDLQEKGSLDDIETFSPTKKAACGFQLFTCKFLVYHLYTFVNMK